MYFGRLEKRIDILYPSQTHTHCLTQRINFLISTINDFQFLKLLGRQSHILKNYYTTRSLHNQSNRRINFSSKTFPTGFQFIVISDFSTHYAHSTSRVESSAKSSKKTCANVFTILHVMRFGRSEKR